MPDIHVAHARLHNQRLWSAGFTRPGEVVSWRGAVQAQDFPGAKWPLALRMRRATGVTVERAFTAGEILRTHVMRPTWHFLAPADIRWMLVLTAPRVRATIGSVTIALDLPGPLRRADADLVAEAAHQYGAFLGQEATLVWK